MLSSFYSHEIIINGENRIRVDYLSLSGYIQNFNLPQSSAASGVEVEPFFFRVFCWLKVEPCANLKFVL